VVHAYTDETVKQAVEAGVMCVDHGYLISGETAKLMAKKGVFLSPQAKLTQLPEHAISWLNDEQRAKFRMARDGLDNALKMAKKYNVKVVFGTDLFGDHQGMQSNEFTARLKWWSPSEIMIQATSATAEMLKLSGKRSPYQKGALGVIEEGAYADMLLIEGNPLEDISVLEDPENNLRLIMKGGVIYKNTL